MLTMEFISGYISWILPALERAGIRPAELSEHITELIYQQIFDHGFSTAIRIRAIYWFCPAV